MKLLKKITNVSSKIFEAYKYEVIFIYNRISTRTRRQDLPKELKGYSKSSMKNVNSIFH